MSVPDEWVLLISPLSAGETVPPTSTSMIGFIRTLPRDFDIPVILVGTGSLGTLFSPTPKYSLSTYAAAAEILDVIAVSVIKMSWLHAASTSSRILSSFIITIDNFDAITIIVDIVTVDCFDVITILDYIVTIDDFDTITDTRVVTIVDFDVTTTSSSLSLPLTSEY